jgi:hypothetical protein
MALGACGEAVEDGGELAGAEDVAGAGEGDDGAELSAADIGMATGELTGVSIGNPGFESDWSGWTRVGATGLSTVAQYGVKSAKVSPGDGQIKKTVGGLQPSTQYVLSAYVNGYARLGVRNHGGTTVSRSLSASSWTKLSVTFTTGSASTSAEIFAAWVGGGDARVDSFTLVPATTTTTTSTVTCSYPSQLIDLGHWKLQLPFGSPTVEVKLPDLATYKNSPYFRPNSTCTGIRFRAPTSGTTTDGAEYARSELREMTADGGSKMQWSTTSGTHRMLIDQAVTSLPRGKKMMAVGQIHNGDNDIIMFRVEGTKLIVKPNGSSGIVLDSNYTLGKRFRVEFVASGGSIKVYYNGSSSPVFTHSRSTTTAYFKAGAYIQSNCATEAAYGQTCGTDNYGEVVMYDLVVRHY